MKLFLTILTLLFFSSVSTFSQIDILGKIKDKVEKKVDEKTDEAIDEGLEELEEGIKNSNKNEDSEENKESSDESLDNEESKKESKTKEDPLTVFRSYDFIPGNNIFFYDNFENDKVGDFPVKWNTSGTGEIVRLSKYPGNWFKIIDATSYVPEINTPLPENYTIEFDIVVQSYDDRDLEHNGYLGDLYFQFHAFTNNDKEYINHPWGYYTADDEATLIVMAGLDFGPAAPFRITNFQRGEAFGLNSTSNLKAFNKKIDKVIHFAMLVNKTRYRLWVDEKKVLDIPKAFPPAKYNVFQLGTGEWDDDDEKYGIYLGNFKFAETTADIRSTFEKEKKIVTRGILFDINSDKIKPESYGVLKDIAQILKDNSSSKFLIVGHTDNDGDEKLNLDLSKRRAASVKNLLVKEFGIDTARLDTDGKGESAPVSNNNTPEGKASNRRVEFIKK
ncbi:MAG: OmpA family protein [Ignavibacteriales bacterium]|nr:OmpA family protein [Ignavibacteriales bacterium]